MQNVPLRFTANSTLASDAMYTVWLTHLWTKTQSIFCRVDDGQRQNSVDQMHGNIVNRFILNKTLKSNWYNTHGTSFLLSCIVEHALLLGHSSKTINTRERKTPVRMQKKFFFHFLFEFLHMFSASCSIVIHEKLFKTLQFKYPTCIDYIESSNRWRYRLANW